MAGAIQEYREQLDTHTKRERRAMAAGTPREWVHETAVDCRVIYDWQRPDEVYDNAFVQDTYLLARTAARQGGLSFGNLA